MRILVTLAALVCLDMATYAQENQFTKGSLRTIQERLNNTSPTDTLLINEQIVSALSQTDDSNEQAKILLIAGSYMVESYHYIRADSLLERCIQMAQDSRTIAEANFQIGLSYSYRDIRVRSLQFFHNALDIYAQLSDSLGMGKTLDRIADNHNYIGEHKMARPFYDRCILIFTAINDTARLSNVLGNIGGMFSEDGQYESALDFYLRAIKLDDLSSDENNLSTHLSGLALAMEGKGRLVEALDYYRQSYFVAYNGGSEVNRAFINQHLGYYYFNIENYDSAKYYMDIAYNFAVKMSNAQLLTNSMDVLHQVAYAQKDFKRAYTIFSEATALSDSLLRSENVSLIASLRTDYELNQKESENSALLQQAVLREEIIKNQSRLNTTLIIGAVLLAMAIVALLLLNQSRRRKNLLIRVDRDLIRNQAEQLKELDDFKSKFFANISHDIRTPITLIKGFTDLIKRKESGLSDESIEYMGYIDENVNRLKSMTDEINQLIQLEENRYQLQYTRIDIKKFFGTLADMFQTGKSNDTVSFHFTDKVAKKQLIRADKAALEKIIFNLVDNAFKYNTTGSRVEMDVKVNEKELIIKITDDGAGVEPEKLDKIFTRYYRTSTSPDAPTGQGIGLSLVKDLVELHGGKISVSSTQGKETCFEVVMPLNLDEPISKKTI